MSGLVAIGIIAAMFGVILGSLPWLASRVRRTGVGAGLMGPIEEIWGYPEAHRARYEIEEQVQRQAPAPSPGDPPTDP